MERKYSEEGAPESVNGIRYCFKEEITLEQKDEK